jgi:tetratricopeptide (TPR) repeat protein
MKKVVFGLLAMFFFSNLVSAQEDPEKALNKADKALAAYVQSLDPTTNEAKLKEAVQMIDIASAADINKGKVRTWQSKGDIYNALADKDLTMLFKNPDAKPENPAAPLIAAESFMKALELAQKKFEIKDAVKGMTESSGKLNNIGNAQIKMNDYKGAFKSLEMVMKINDAVKKHGGDPVIAEADMANHKYVVAYCASAAGDKEAALKLFKELYEAGSKEASVYAQYFDMLYATGQKEEAWKVFDKGQAAFPTSTEILFSGINAKIAEQDYEALKQLLGKAIAAEPNNPSIYSALGNVYMNLFNDEYAKDKNSALAKEYFDESLSYFNKAVSLDAKQFDAVYSIGSLYFNKAVELIKAANLLPMDKESQKKYKVMLDESTSLMATALPYFQKTEAMQPSDVNTLIALSEIYARMNDLEKSKEFKTRLEKAKAGQDVGPAYFKN